MYARYLIKVYQLPVPIEDHFSGSAALKRLNPTRHASHEDTFMSFITWSGICVYFSK
jgi:hypothetical protein